MKEFVKVSYGSRNEMEVEIIESNLELLKKGYEKFVDNYDDKEYIEEFGYFEEFKVGAYIEGREEEESYLYIDSSINKDVVENIKELLDKEDYEKVEDEIIRFECK